MCIIIRKRNAVMVGTSINKMAETAEICSVQEAENDNYGRNDQYSRSNRILCDLSFSRSRVDSAFEAAKYGT
jgi:hypothetical protein